MKAAGSTFVSRETFRQKEEKKLAQAPIYELGNKPSFWLLHLLAHLLQSLKAAAAK